jgi:hypothetical protein
MLLGRFRCLFLAHQPDRRRVKKVGTPLDYTYYGYCTHCGAKIRRVKRDRWTRAFHWPEGAME